MPRPISRSTSAGDGRDRALRAGATLRAPDGETIWVSIAASAVRGADGRFAYAVHVVRDVSERRAGEARRSCCSTSSTTGQEHARDRAVARGADHRGTGALAAYRETFEARLIALSKAHDLLTRRGWESAP